MVCRHHQDHLDELGGPVGQAPPKPQQREHPAHADVVGDGFGDGHLGERGGDEGEEGVYKGV